MKILVTGFEPDEGESFSPTLETVKMLPIMVENSFIVKAGVPRLYFKAIESVTTAIEEHEPDAVLMTGQKPCAFGLCPEFAALNYIDATQPDLQGNKPLNTAVIPTGPAAYITTLPINGMVNLIRRGGVPAEVSYSAGIALNNHLMYGVSHHIRSNHLDIIVGFIHLPLTPAQAVSIGAGTPSMSIEDMRKGLQCALSAVSIYLEKISVKKDKPIRIVNSTSGQTPIARISFHTGN